ncbi:MAG TPA: nucleotidyltransferase [Verrucomicrobiae bacterium]|nr:nucleotidyltransferase [Verrucomicrobiae bacterium]
MATINRSSMTDILKSEKAVDFYTDSLKILNSSGIPFMVGGTFAVNAYLELSRPTKDLDVFCKAGDYPKIVNVFSEAGYRIQVTDERWLAKVFKHRHFFDLIFNSVNAPMPVTDDWFKESQTRKILGIEVKVLPATELIWSKAFVQNRDKFDGNDIVHLMLTENKNTDWKRLLHYMDHYWEVLFIHILRFRFVYPSEREKVPKWLLDELVQRFLDQIKLPTAKEKSCRGRLLSYSDFEIDVTKWGFSDIYGWSKNGKTS